jgi:DNA polymerase-3 subunit delta'
MAELNAPSTLQAPWLQDAWQALRGLQTRSAHAVLLHGAAGLGKKQLALDYAAGLLCEAPGAGGAACGQCAGCRLCLAGNHPDLRVVVPDSLAALRPASSAGADADEEDSPGLESAVDAGAERKDKRVSREIRIEQVRALLDFVNVAAHRAGMRVIVLAPAEALNTAAANALLKMLEEPPAATVFVLTCDALDPVLPTIRSRCVLLRVAAPSWPQAAAWLATLGVTDGAQRLAATGGAPWPAALEEGADPLDAAARALLLDLLGQGPRLAAADVVARVPKTIDTAGALSLLQRWGWDLLALQSGSSLRYHAAQLIVLTRLAALMTPSALLNWLATLGQLRRSAEHPLNVKLVLESALLAYIHLWRAVPARS